MHLRTPLLAQVTPFPLSSLASSLSKLRGVGPVSARALAAKGLTTWGDALFFFPNRYEDRRRVTPIAEVQEGQLAVVKGVVESSGRWGNKGKLYRMLIDDGSGLLPCLWFRYQRAHLESFAPGQELFVVGQLSQGQPRGLQMVHPELYRADEVGEDHPALGRVVPVYPEVEGVRPASLRKVMAEMIKCTTSEIEDPLYGQLPAELYTMPAGEALARAHQPPKDSGDLDLDPARAPWLRALAVNELLYFELGLALKRKRREASSARPLNPPGLLLKRLLAKLPFELTQGQAQAVEIIQSDMALPRPMGRLLCGDVATGKTVVAACAAALAAEAGVQTAIMAPTEVLARQHQATLSSLLEPLGLRVALAIGAQNGAERQQAAEAAQGGAQVMVGTHALFSQHIQFADLGLVVIDEQHRFGVHQRLALSSKGERPHLLVLSATPIPRTLALALAGHLEISDLPQRPGGQPKVKTCVLQFDQRRAALEALGETLKRGEQAYVVCPLVEASDKIEAQDVVQTHRRLDAFFPEVEVGLLHGRMDSDAQQAALDAFRCGQSRLLVATTVVEVGVDVPAAALMVVLAAERFGLSQLHQLRGRVGRGDSPGSCMLVAGNKPGDLARRRLEVLATSTDGMVIAEADLHLRGPGEALGQRQSGLPPFKVARWERDAELVPALRKIIAGWLQKDPQLTGPDLFEIKQETLRRWGRRLGLAQAG